MHRKISQTMLNFAWCEKFICYCLVVSQGVRNFAQGAEFSFTQSCSCSSSWFSLSLIGLATYCQAWQRLWSAQKFGIFMHLSFNLHCHGLHKILPHSWFDSMIKKLPKTPKLAKNWLVTLARFFNVPIELKGINYYSKVFKIVNFKL